MTFSGKNSPPAGKAAVTGAILAGGLSRRLGRDKVTLPLKGKPLARWVAEALAPAVFELWLVTNHPKAHLALGLPLLTDLLPLQGPLGGLATALFFPRTPWVLVAAADAPLLAPSLVKALVQAVPNLRRPVLVCRSARGLEPFPGLYATRLLPRLWEVLPDHPPVTAWVESLRPQVWEPETWQAYDPEGLSFINLNRENDLKRLGDLNLSPV